MKKQYDHFELLRKLGNKPRSSQRKLAEELGFSLGKLNYCLNELKKKGLIQVKNFKKSRNKLSYFYMLTFRFYYEKNLTINFMKIKIKEYDELKLEMNNTKYNINE